MFFFLFGVGEVELVGWFLEFGVGLAEGVFDASKGKKGFFFGIDFFSWMKKSNVEREK